MILILLLSAVLVSEKPSLADDKIVRIQTTISETSESEGEAVYQLTFSEPSDVPIVVLYSTVAGTAIAGEDFLAASGHVTVPAGELEGDIRIDLIDDDIAEEEETFALYLTVSPSAALLSSTRIKTVITDDDEGEAPRVLAAASPLTTATGEATNAAIVDGGPARANRVVIHYNNARNFDDVDMVRRWLENAGYPQPEVRVVGFDIARTNIRYFFEVDRDNAADIDQIVRDAIGDLSEGARDFTTYTPLPIAGTIEVWIASDLDAGR